MLDHQALRRRITSLHGRMTLVLGGALGLLTVAHALHGINLQEKRITEGIRERVQTIGHSTVDYISRAMIRGEHTRIADVLTFGEIDPSVYVVQVVDPSGHILHSSTPTSTADIVHVPTGWLDPGAHDYEEIDDDAVTTLWPIERRQACTRCHGGGDAPIAWLRISASLSQADLHWTAVQEVLGGSAITLFASLALVIWVASHTLVRRPINRLIATMRRVESGDMGARCDVGGPEEITKLGRSFNSMIERLETAQKRVRRYHEKLLAQAQRVATVGEMASSIAHEVKNPLAGVAGVLNVILQEDRVNGEFRPQMEEALEQIKRVDHTISDLLAFARTAEMQRQPVDINRVIREAVAIVTVDPACNGHQVRTELDPGLDDRQPPLLGDERLLFQAVLNVSLNGLQAMREPGCLTVRSRWDQAVSEARIEVQDTGPGVAPELRGHIFKPFQSTKIKGAGLGLSIARSIAQEHEGFLDLAQAEQGAMFVFRLPIGPVADETSDGLPDPGQGGARVMTRAGEELVPSGSS